MKKFLLSFLCLTLLLSASAFISGCDKHAHAFTQEIAMDDFKASNATCTEKAKYYNIENMLCQYHFLNLSTKNIKNFAENQKRARNRFSL